jgi:hypothetical protein
MARVVTIEADDAEPFLNGEQRGKVERGNLDLDRIDGTDEHVVLKFDPAVVTSSFIEGLVGPSVDTLGYSGFKQKYRIEGTRPVIENVLATAQFLEDTKSR